MAVRVELKKETGSAAEARVDTELRNEVAAAETRVQPAGAERQELRQIINRQGEEIAVLRGHIEAILSRENDLRKVLLTADSERDELRKQFIRSKRERDELHRRNVEVYDELYALQTKVALLERNRLSHGAEQGVDPQSEAGIYKQLVIRIRDAVRASLPNDSTVIVATKGDNDLLRLYGRQAWHFPQAENGQYAGHHPLNSTAAIVQLELLRGRGANHLLLPNTMLWWLDHYKEFKRYLETYYRLVVREDDTCVIYALIGEAAETSPGWQSLVTEAIAACCDQIGRKPSILDWNTRLNLAARFPDLTIFPAPKGENVLPYMDESIDIVAVASWDFISRTEAQRVAGKAVMKFSQLQNASHHEPTLEIDWKSNVKSIAQTMTSSIVIPCCNSVAETETCLAAVTDSLPRSFSGEIIVVDATAAEDLSGGLHRLAKSDHRIKIYRSEKQEGFFPACNSGAKTATGDILIFVNSTVAPLAGWLPALLQTFHDYPKAGAVGVKHVCADGKLQEAGGVVFSNGSIARFGDSDSNPDTPLYNFVREVDYCSVTVLATRRSLFEELKGFDADFSSLDYGAADYGLRIRSKGHHVYYQPESAATNADGRFMGLKSMHNEDQQGRSREMLSKRWADTLKERPAPPLRFDTAAWQDLAGR